MSTFIIYPVAEGTAVLFPNLNCGLTLQEIAIKDVPQGVPFLFVEEGDLPDDLDTWQVDFTEPDGHGDPESYWAAQG